VAIFVSEENFAFKRWSLEIVDAVYTRQGEKLVELVVVAGWSLLSYHRFRCLQDYTVKDVFLLFILPSDRRYLDGASH